MPSPSTGVIVRTSRQTPSTMHSINATYSVVAWPRHAETLRGGMSHMGDDVSR